MASFATSTFFLRSASRPGAAASPRATSSGTGCLTATNAPIVIGDVAIAPGDFMLGDRDGLIRVPKALAETVVDKAEAAMIAENLVRKAILAGDDPQQAYLKYGKF